jgi:hypothetical protein
MKSTVLYGGDQRLLLHIRAGDERDAAVSVHMVAAVLSIIFD